MLRKCTPKRLKMLHTGKLGQKLIRDETRWRFAVSDIESLGFNHRLTPKFQKSQGRSKLNIHEKQQLQAITEGTLKWKCY